MKDLFDILGISLRENSYTTLLATLFEKSQEQQWAHEYFERTFGCPSPSGRVRVKVRPRLRSGSKRASIPDLVLAFGEPVTDVWVIEAKIKAGEGVGQLEHYESQEIKAKILDVLRSEVADLRWHYTYLTLEGEVPTGDTKFVEATYEPLNDIFPPVPELPQEILPAYHCLRERFLDYYSAQKNDPDLTSTLGNYLSKCRGLILEEDRFRWLMRWATKEFGLHSEFLTVHNMGSANPACLLRGPGWRGESYPWSAEQHKEGGTVRLRESFDIHCEVQLLSGKGIRLMLHYETNPYKEGLKNLRSVNQEELAEYWEQRERFARTLYDTSDSLKEAGWKFTSLEDPNRYPVQLAKVAPDFDLRLTAEEFRERLEYALRIMERAVEESSQGILR